jgi:hypothetical protein
MVGLDLSTTETKWCSAAHAFRSSTWQRSGQNGRQIFAVDVFSMTSSDNAPTFAQIMATKIS